MALRRGDWETGDVICHECHLTAPSLLPPFIPICLLIHVSAFLSHFAPQLPLPFPFSSTLLHGPCCVSTFPIVSL